MKNPRVTDVIKANGVGGMKEMTAMTGQSPATLRNWYRNKRDLFDICLIGCAFVKKTREAQAMIDQATKEIQDMHGGLNELVAEKEA